MRQGRLPAVVLGLWGLYCLLSAWYALPSGMPQPADLVMVLLVTMLALQVVIHRALPMEADYQPILIFASGFLGYVILITLYRAVELADPALMRFPVYYGYNVAVLGAGIVLGVLYRERFLQITVVALTLIGLLQIAWLLLSGEDRPDLRATGFFNNPNQFGYAGLLLVMIAVTSMWAGAVRNLLAAIAISVGVVIIAMSLSKAAILGLLVLSPVAFYLYPAYSVLGLAILAAIGYMVKDLTVVDIMIRQFRA
ncbi:MAG: hypothetical protein U5P41_08925 [Gammaproteobacteria bacterium]|nr:hypothetical protein [Gammaproteobacteria bacterium]